MGRKKYISEPIDFSLDEVENTSNTNSVGLLSVSTLSGRKDGVRVGTACLGSPEPDCFSTEKGEKIMRRLRHGNGV